MLDLNPIQTSQNTIILKSSKALHLIDPKEILYCKIENENVIIKLLSNENVKTSHTLKELENKLVNHNFYRCHAQCLVNLNSIKQYTHKTGELLMKDNNSLIVAKDRRALFNKLIKSL